MVWYWYHTRLIPYQGQRTSGKTCLDMAAALGALNLGLRAVDEISNLSKGVSNWLKANKDKDAVRFYYREWSRTWNNAVSLARLRCLTHHKTQLVYYLPVFKSSRIFFVVETKRATQIHLVLPMSCMTKRGTARVMWAVLFCKSSSSFQTELWIERASKDDYFRGFFEL